MDSSPSRRRHKRKRKSRSPSPQQRRDKKSREPKEERKSRNKEYPSGLPDLLFSASLAGPHITKAILKDYPKAQNVDAAQSRARVPEVGDTPEVQISQELRDRVLAFVRQTSG